MPDTNTPNSIVFTIPHSFATNLINLNDLFNTLIDKELHPKLATAHDEIVAELKHQYKQQVGHEVLSTDFII